MHRDDGSGGRAAKACIKKMRQSLGTRPSWPPRQPARQKHAQQIRRTSQTLRLAFPLLSPTLRDQGTVTLSARIG